MLHRGSEVVACGVSGPVAHGVFPGPGIESMSPALDGRFLTTGPPGNSLLVVFGGIHVFSIYYLPGTVLGTGNVMRKKRHTSCSYGMY